MNIIGKHVIIEPTFESDLPFLKTLWNDGRVMKWVGFPDGLGYTDKPVHQWFIKRFGRQGMNQTIKS